MYHTKENFNLLGKNILNILNNNTDNDLSCRYSNRLNEAICRQAFINAWHTPQFTRLALQNIGEHLMAWNDATETQETNPTRIGVIHDGIIPLDGIEILFDVLASGNAYVGKLSANDKSLIPLICELLIDICPDMRQQISFTERLRDIDKVIATDHGNATLMHYLSQYPHIFVPEQHAIAILDGRESDEELKGLCDDILLFFGQGNKAISKIFVPEDYEFGPLFDMLNRHFPEMATHHHYLNNLEYQKTLLLMSQTKFLDSGIMAFVENTKLASPVAVTFTQHYNSLTEVMQFIDTNESNISHIITHLPDFKENTPFGRAHRTFKKIM